MAVMSPLLHLLVALLPALTLAQSYSCDPSVCRLPSCNCARTSPPGDLSPSQVPQFIVYTADDAIQSYTLDSVNQFLAHRRNPNGCSPKMTYFASLGFTNYSLITDWYVAGNEIADHTMTHVGSPPVEEINGNLIALNALAGIPLSAIKGFRAPYLDFTPETLKQLHQSEFLYDSSASASVPVTDSNTDAYWPYTLDNGLANNCQTTAGVCNGEPKLPGLWEIPMYSFFDERGVNGPHLMDPWLDRANGNSAPNDDATLSFMQSTFTAHYDNNRQPIGLYTHPIHLSLTYPGATVNRSTINMVNRYLDWAQEHDNVWIVSNEQLLDWVRNPVPASQVGSIPSFQCQSSPRPAASESICNGVAANQNDLIGRCGFNDFPFFTCYGCPSTVPTPQNPNPAQADGEQVRFRLPANCSTTFWDPIQGRCTCTEASCAFTDVGRSIGPNGAKFSGGGMGGAPVGGSNSPSDGTDSDSDNDSNNDNDGPKSSASGLLPSPLVAAVSCIVLWVARSMAL